MDAISGLFDLSAVYGIFRQHNSFLQFYSSLILVFQSPPLHSKHIELKTSWTLPNGTGIQPINFLFFLYPVALIGTFTNKTQVCLPVRNILSECERFTLYCLMKRYLTSSNNHMLLKTVEWWISCNNNTSNMSIKCYFMVILCMRSTIFLNGKWTSESSTAGSKNTAWVQSRPLECSFSGIFWGLLLSYCKHNNWNWKQILVW